MKRALPKPEPNARCLEQTRVASVLPLLPTTLVLQAHAMNVRIGSSFSLRSVYVERVFSLKIRMQNGLIMSP
jgi:hypothetical protein